MLCVVEKTEKGYMLADSEFTDKAEVVEDSILVLASEGFKIGFKLSKVEGNPYIEVNQYALRVFEKKGFKANLLLFNNHNLLLVSCNSLDYNHYFFLESFKTERWSDDMLSVSLDLKENLVALIDYAMEVDADVISRRDLF